LYLGGRLGLDLKNKITGKHKTMLIINSAIKYSINLSLYSSKCKFSSKKKVGKIYPKIIPSVLDIQQIEVAITL
jgi:hypothetical protein